MGASFAIGKARDGRIIQECGQLALVSKAKLAEVPRSITSLADPGECLVVQVRDAEFQLWLSRPVIAPGEDILNNEPVRRCFSSAVCYGLPLAI